VVISRCRRGVGCEKMKHGTVSPLDFFFSSQKIDFVPGAQV